MYAYNVSTSRNTEVTQYYLEFPEYQKIKHMCKQALFFDFSNGPGFKANKGNDSTYYLNGAVSNSVPWFYRTGWSKAFNQCAIQCGGCSGTQCWCEQRTICPKPSHACSCEDITRPTNSSTTWCYMSQVTQKIVATSHSPECDSTHASIDSTSEGDGIIRTGRGSWSELTNNITWREIIM